MRGDGESRRDQCHVLSAGNLPSVDGRPGGNHRRPQADLARRPPRSRPCPRSPRRAMPAEPRPGSAHEAMGRALSGAVSSPSGSSSVARAGGSGPARGLDRTSSPRCRHTNVASARPEQAEPARACFPWFLSFHARGRNSLAGQASETRPRLYVVRPGETQPTRGTGRKPPTGRRQRSIGRTIPALSRLAIARTHLVRAIRPARPRAASRTTGCPCTGRARVAAAP